MSHFSELFPSKPFIGVIHLPALPGAPLYGGGMGAVFEYALAQASLLGRYVDGIIIENFGDKPFFPNRVPAQTVAAMSAVTRELVAATKLPVGVNVLRNDAEAALAVAVAAQAHFIRVNVHTAAVVADQGIIEGKAYETLRLRKLLCAGTLIFADVGVKHASPMADRGLAIETQDLAERGLADAIIVSGARTGDAANAAELDLVKANTRLPVLVGSGTRPDTLPQIRQADGYIVGSYLKQGGKVTNPLDEVRLAEMRRLIG